MPKRDDVYASYLAAAWNAVRQQLDVAAFRVCLETELVAAVAAFAAFATLHQLAPTRGPWLGALAALALGLLGWLIGHLRGARFRQRRPLTPEKLFPELAAHLTDATGGSLDYAGLVKRPERYDARTHAWAIARWRLLHEGGYEGSPFAQGPSLVRLALVLGLAVIGCLLVAFVAYDPALDAGQPLALLDPNHLTLPVLLLALAVVWFALCGLAVLAAGVAGGTTDLGEAELDLQGGEETGGSGELTEGLLDVSEADLLDSTGGRGLSPLDEVPSSPQPVLGWSAAGPSRNGQAQGTARGGPR